MTGTSCHSVGWAVSLLDQQGAVRGPCPETAVSEEPFWQSRNGTSFILRLVGKGQPLIPAVQVGEIPAGAQVF